MLTGLSSVEVMMVFPYEGYMFDETPSDTMVEGISIKLEMIEFLFVNPLRISILLIYYFFE